MSNKLIKTCIITGGRNAHIDKEIEISPTLLARIWKGFDTYGIPAVIEIKVNKDDSKKYNVTTR